MIENYHPEVMRRHALFVPSQAATPAHELRATGPYKTGAGSIVVDLLPGRAARDPDSNSSPLGKGKNPRLQGHIWRSGSIQTRQAPSVEA